MYFINKHVHKSYKESAKTSEKWENVHKYLYRKSRNECSFILEKSSVVRYKCSVKILDGSSMCISMGIKLVLRRKKTQGL